MPDILEIKAQVDRHFMGAHVSIDVYEWIAAQRRHPLSPRRGAGSARQTGRRASLIVHFNPQVLGKHYGRVPWAVVPP
jgi:hypothetical protein